MKVTKLRSFGKVRTQSIVALAELVESMKTETKSRPVSLARGMMRDTNPSLWDDYVYKLPLIHTGGTFRRVDDNSLELLTYSGLQLLEVNHLPGAAEVRKVKQLAAELPQTLLAVTGVSGRSVKILVRFAYPDESLPTDRASIDLFHAHAYQRAVRYYEPYLAPFAFELKEPTVLQSFRYTFDPDPYFAPEAPVIILRQPDAMPAETPGREARQPIATGPLPHLLPGYERHQVISTLFESSLEEACTATAHLDNDRYLKPLLIRLAQNCADSAIPEEEAVQWAARHLRKSCREEEIRLTFRNAYQIDKEVRRPCIGKILNASIRTEEFMHRRYDFRYNTMLRTVEYRERNTFQFRFHPINERVLNSIALNAMKENLELWDRDVRRYIHSDRVPVYSPVNDWLDQLPDWDGTDRIRPLADTVPCRHPHWRNLFYRWFLSMVSHWQGHNKMHGNSTSPLLVGPQGYRKSTFCRSLLPPDLSAYYTDSIDFSRKRDAELFLNCFLLINIDEFDSISPAHQAFLKHILQKPVVNTRLPNQSTVEQLRRYASFIGTSNQPDLLTDPSGSRRFICIEVTGPIDFSRPIYYEQLYAQALDALRDGERAYLDAEEEALVTEHNQAFQQEPAIEQLFHHYFRAAREGEECELLSPAEIMLRIQQKSGVKMPMSKVTYFGRLLRKDGVLHHRVAKCTLYKVVAL